MKKYTQLRNGSRQPLERILPLNFPISMYIETTNRCNIRCTYCPLSLDKYSKTVGGFKTMSLDVFEKIARDIAENGPLKVLRFYLMGEPLVNPKLPEMISIASTMKLSERIELTSNGFLLDENKSIALINSGLDYLRISVSSVDPERHKRVTQSNYAVSKLYDNIQNFRRLRDSLSTKKPFLYVKMLDSLDKKENEKFIEMYESIADEVLLEQPMNWDGYDGEDLLESTYNDQAKNLKGLYPYKKTVCPFPFYTLTINVDGDVTVCCVDWNKDTAVGNIHENSLKRIWNGEKMKNFLKMQISGARNNNPSCSNCQFLYTTPDNIDDMEPTLVDSIIKAKKSAAQIPN